MYDNGMRTMFNCAILRFMSSFGPPLTHEQQVNLLILHGLCADNDQERAEIAERLRNIGYYRLEEYTWPFRKLNKDAAGNLIPYPRSPYFKDGIHMHLIWETYLFDRRLRILLLDAIERFELSMRNRITQILVDAAGHNLPHNDTRLIPAFASNRKGAEWKNKLNSRFRSDSSERIQHCKNEHHAASIANLPLWIVMELTTLGSLKTLYESLHRDLQNQLAASMNLDAGFITSSFILLHQVRNKCAHHSRIWNIQWSKQKSPNQSFRKPFFNHCLDPEWNSFLDPNTQEWMTPDLSSPPQTNTTSRKQYSVSTKSTAFAFLLCGFWLDLMAQTSHWKERVLMTIYHEGKLLRAAKEAGFVEQWERHPIWKKD